MYQLLANHPLLCHNTFGIDVKASHFVTIHSAQELIQFSKENPLLAHKSRLIIGGGSNLLFLNDFNGVVIQPMMKEVTVVNQQSGWVEVEVGAGVIWDDFVQWCVERGYGGAENLSLIPGHVGAVPVQNIGAYGVEVASIIVQVKGINMNTLQAETISQLECRFDYRASIFKEELKDTFVVTSVIFRLSTNPVYQLQYDGLEDKVREWGSVNLASIRKTIIAIRSSKLPDPSVIGNAGSFFKNPTVDVQQAGRLKQQFPSMPQYRVNENRIKLAAGWLIDQAGWKGKSRGKAAVHANQALVIINQGGATGQEILSLSKEIELDVLKLFGVKLEREVQTIS